MAYNAKASYLIHNGDKALNLTRNTATLHVRESSTTTACARLTATPVVVQKTESAQPGLF